jgi:hypothetical protein
VLRCNEHTTLDDFGSGILAKNEKDDFFGSTNAANVNVSQHCSYMSCFSS